MSTPSERAETCHGCAFWKPEFDRREIDWRGECRRHAPTYPLVVRTHLPVSDGDTRAWPFTTPKDWCGDFEASGVTPDGEGGA